MRKHLLKALQTAVFIALVVWTLDGHVPGLNETVAPEPAPMPVPVAKFYIHCGWGIKCDW